MTTMPLPFRAPRLCEARPSWRLLCEPGDGTRYDLHVVEDPAGGLLAFWPDNGLTVWISTTSEHCEIKGWGSGGAWEHAYSARTVARLVREHLSTVRGV